jgi:putative sterol carrier protein
MGYYSRVAVVTAPAVVPVEGEKIPTPEELASDMDRILSLEGAGESRDVTAALGDMLNALSSPGRDRPAESKGGLTVEGVFDRITEAFQPDKAAGVDVVFQFRITGPDGGDWFVTVKDGACNSKKGTHEKPTTTISMADDDFVSMIGGTLNAMQAYTSGKLKISGDLMKSQLIEKLFKF